MNTTFVMIQAVSRSELQRKCHEVGLEKATVVVGMTSMLGLGGRQRPCLFVCLRREMVDR
jgi:hypothetical protein